MRRIKFFNIVVLMWMLALGVGRALALGPVSAPPEHPGNSGVIRFTDGMGFFFIDYQSGLMSFHGIQTSFAELCAGSPPVFDPLNIQLIFSPTGTLHGLITAEAHTVFIHPAATFPDPHHIGLADCPILLSLPLLATGQARVIRTDNDIFGSDAPGANSFGLNSTGMLEDMVNGGTVGYVEVFQGLVKPNSDEVTVVKLSITLSPTANP
jgi:hypothetical protein